MYDADAPMLVGIILLISALVGILATGILGGSVFPYTPDDIYLKTISIDSTPVRVEVADTPAQRQQGLSGRTRMAENRGMLFVFDEPGRYGIWMKDTLFPLDVYWLDDEGTIVDMWEYARPESYPLVYEPREEAYYIVEVVGGFSEVYNIDIGDTVTGL